MWKLRKSEKMHLLLISPPGMAHSSWCVLSNAISRSSLQNDIMSHTCNFVTFWWLVPFAVCFWWMYKHIFLQKNHVLQHVRTFTKLCSPLQQEAHFWNPNSEQSAFKTALFGALKALDKHYIGYLFGTYRSFAPSVRPSSASIAHQNFDSRSWLVQF